MKSKFYIKRAKNQNQKEIFVKKSFCGMFMFFFAMFRTSCLILRLAHKLKLILCHNNHKNWSLHTLMTKSDGIIYDSVELIYTFIASRTQKPISKAPVNSDDPFSKVCNIMYWKMICLQHQKSSFFILYALYNLKVYFNLQTA